MARVYQDGFEFNSVTANPSTWETISGSPTISSTVFRSGAYAGRVSSLSSGAAKGWVKKWLSSTADGPYWGRVYLRVATRPSASNHIISFNSASGTAGNSERIKITLESDGTLILRQADGTAIGSPSAVLSLDTWYMVELKFDRTPAAGSEIAEARLDGSVFATSNTLTYAGAAFAFSIGGNLDLEAQTQGDWYFDDVAINDNTGSFQTSYPGSGKIIHLRPSAAGDTNGFLVNVGGTAGAGNNFTRVNEITPDDATSYNASAVLNAEDLFNVDDSGIASGDTVNVVMVGGRFADTVAADATTAIKFEIEKTGSGTKTQSAAIVPNSTSWNTNGTTSPRNYPIVTYQDPDSSNWTQTTLDSMQIGYLESTANVQSAAITNVWASVDYTPATATTSTSTTTSTTTTTSTSTTSTSSSTSTTSTSSSTSTSTTRTTTSTTTSTSSSTSTTSTSSSTSTTTTTSTSTSTTSTSSSTSTSTSSSTSTSTTVSVTTSTSTSTSTTSTSSSTTTSSSTSTSTTSTSSSTTTSITTTTSTSTTSTSSSTSTTTSTSTSTTSTSSSTSTTTTTSTSTTSTSSSTSTTTSTSSSTTTSTTTTIYPACGNLVLNPSFETPAAANGTTPTNWTAFNSAGVQDYKGNANDFSFDGYQAFKIAASSNTDTGIKIQIPLNVNEQVTLSAYIKTDADVTNAAIVMNTRSDGGGSSTAQNLGANQNGRFSITSTGPWTNGYVEIFLGLGSFGAQSKGTVWFDAIQLERGATATTYCPSSTTTTTSTSSSSSTTTSTASVTTSTSTSSSTTTSTTTTWEYVFAVDEKETDFLIDDITDTEMFAEVDRKSD